MREEHDDHDIFRYADFNVVALCQLASKLREGHACHCNMDQSPSSGSFSWSIIISFGDAVEWILRSPRKDGAIRSTNTNTTLLASEAATLKYIAANSDVPVPKVFAYSDSKDSPIGIPYILMSKALGIPLQHKWSSTGKDELNLCEEHKAKIMYQLGNITWKLSRLRFQHIGSLFEVGETFEVGTCLSRGLLMHERDTLDNLYRGPFTSELEFYEALFLAFSEHVKYLPLYHHCFLAPVPARDDYDDNLGFESASNRWSDFVTVGSKIDAASNRLNYVVAGEILKKWIPRSTDSALGDLKSGCSNHYPLYHPDLSVNNIFVDDNFNITCIIDWAFCSSVPLSVLLMPPGLPQSRNEVDPALLPAFQGGFDYHSRQSSHQDPEQDAAFLRIIRSGRSAWLLSRFLNFDSIADYSLFMEICVINGVNEEAVMEEFRSMLQSNRLLNVHQELKEDDESAKQVAESESQYFKGDVSRLAVSRKLTLLAQWSSPDRRSLASGIRSNSKAFVADKKLWKWMENCLEKE